MKTTKRVVSTLLFTLLLSLFLSTAAMAQFLPAPTCTGDCTVNDGSAIGTVASTVNTVVNSTVVPVLTTFGQGTYNIALFVVSGAATIAGWAVSMFSN